MSDPKGTSRRKFIGTAGAAAAAVGVAGAIPGFASTPASKTAAQPVTTLGRSVVVSVVDPAAGVFNVMYGETSVEVVDKAFAGKLASLIV